MKLGSLWIVRTSNSTDSYSGDDLVFCTQQEAREEASRLARIRARGRSDYVAVPLWRLIEDYANAMADTAMDEG